MGGVVAYYRVSTARQGRSGLGLEAQRAAVQRYIEASGANLLAEFQDIETGKGANAMDRRPGLRDAVSHAKRKRAVLLIAKLDRLARNVHFVSGLMETGVQFRCCDQPDADRTMLHIYATMAEHEGRRISTRIREALAAKKARGQTLGNLSTLEPLNGARKAAAEAFAEGLRATIKGYQAQGVTQRAMVDALNLAGVPTARRQGCWSLMQLQRIVARLERAGKS